MSDFLKILLDSINFLWPFRKVEHWEVGGYYVFGRWNREVGPGIWPIIPWFTEVMTCSTAEAIVGTGRQDITLQDGSMLSFSATAVVRVKDAYSALNLVDQYHETMQELLSSVLADKLATVDASRFEPEKRGRLAADLQRWVQEEATPYGIEVKKVRFTSFLSNVKSHRLIIDQQHISPW